jgi:hypothetical protein
MVVGDSVMLGASWSGNSTKLHICYRAAGSELEGGGRDSFWPYIEEGKSVTPTCQLYSPLLRSRDWLLEDDVDELRS